MRVAAGQRRDPVCCFGSFEGDALLARPDPRQRRDFGREPPGEYGGTPEEYRQSLRDAVAATGHPNAHLVEGPELLTDISGLSADLIHPADYGMLEMGQRLADRLSALLAR